MENKISLIRFLPISTIECGNRTKNCLYANDVITLGDLLILSYEQIGDMRGAGIKTIAEILELQSRIIEIIEGFKTGIISPSIRYLPRINSLDNNVFNKSIDVLALSQDNRVVLKKNGIQSCTDLLAKSTKGLLPAFGYDIQKVRVIVDSVFNYYIIADKKQFDYDDNAMRLMNLGVVALGLSVRTINTLHKNSIYKVSDILNKLDNLSGLRGLGNTGIREIEKGIERLCDLDVSAIEGNGRPAESIKIYDALKSHQTNDRNLDILIKYFNSRSSTFESVSSNYGISRERVRQLISKQCKKLKMMYDAGAIDCGDILGTIDRYHLPVETSTIKDLSDGELNSRAICVILCKLIPDRYALFTDFRINGEWLCSDKKQLLETLDDICDLVKSERESIDISLITEKYSVSEDFIYSIKNIVITGEGINTRRNSKISRGDVITGYFEKVKRPVSIGELVENTDLTPNQVRGALFNNDEFENVGKSVYALKYYDYTSVSSENLIKGLLLAENRALKYEYVLKYLNRYKNLEIFDVVRLVKNNPELFKIQRSKIGLVEWDDNKFAKSKIKNYEIKLGDVMLEALDSFDGPVNVDDVLGAVINRYGDRVSNSRISANSLLNKLAERELAIRVGNGYYMRATNYKEHIYDYYGSDIAKKQNKSYQYLAEHGVDQDDFTKYLSEHINDFIYVIYLDGKPGSANRYRKLYLLGFDDKRFNIITEFSKREYSYRRDLVGGYCEFEEYRKTA